MVQELATPHGVSEMRSPVVGMVHIGHGCGDAALGHDGVRLAKQRLTDDTHRGALRERLNSGAQTSATCANDQDIVFVGFKFCGHRIVMSRSTPAATSRM